VIPESFSKTLKVELKISLLRFISKDHLLTSIMLRRVVKGVSEELRGYSEADIYYTQVLFS
jgi:hypothetical protein